MLKFELKHVEAVIASGIAGEVSGDLDDDARYDLAVDALLNEAPVVASSTAEQDKGEYSVVILGVPGAYYVQAPEYDDDGVFDSLADAESFVDFNYGEFIVDRGD